MLTLMIALNTVCLAAVAALWVWSVRRATRLDSAPRFAAVLDTAQRIEREQHRADGDEACS